MINLFEKDEKTNIVKSSKGNQLKWQKGNYWYKADYTGYEGLSEYIVSTLLEYSNLKENEYVKYQPIQINYEDRIFNGVVSENLLNKDWQIITIERLFNQVYNKSLNNEIWNIIDPQVRLSFIVEEVIKITGLKHFGEYLNKILTIDALFLNEDRHTHNIAVLMNSKGEFDYCPVFDNGAGLLSDTTMDYPLEKDFYVLINKAKAKTFYPEFDIQLELAEKLYGNILKFTFLKKDVEHFLALDNSHNDSEIYPIEIRERVRDIIFEQMRKYPYLFKK